MTTQHHSRQQGMAHPFLALALALVILLGLAAAVAYILAPQGVSMPDTDTSPDGVQEVIRGTYSPPFIPVTLSVDSSGILRVNAGSHMVTPAGTFSMEWERQKIFHVEITLGTETRFYQLGDSKFKIYLPNSLDGDTSIRYDGEGNVRILVPDPGEVGFPDSNLREEDIDGNAEPE